MQRSRIYELFNNPISDLYLNDRYENTKSQLANQDKKLTYYKKSFYGSDTLKKKNRDVLPLVDILYLLSGLKRPTIIILINYF